MIQTTASGRLVADISIDVTQNGKKYAKFTLASRGRNKDEEGKNIPDYIDCIAWNTTAENMNKFQLKKGFDLLISGQLTSRVYKNQKGDNVKTWTLEVEHFENHTTRDEACEMAMSSGGSKTTGKNEEVKMFEPVLDDNLPF